MRWKARELKTTLEATSACNDWLVRCGGGSVRAETKSRQHQQYIRVL